tara:strand:+ start:556 stop:1002 length:447 start_codon:yes stop_codon:yes gene_type:complete
VHYKFSQDDVVHWILPKDEVVWTWVIENEDEKGNKVVTDFFSMYRLTQTCTSKKELGHKWDVMHSGCLFYYALTANTLGDMIKECMWRAKEEADCDAFSVQTLMDNTNDLFIDELRFCYGDGALHWYLVNWALGGKKVTSNDIGTMLI